MVLFFCLTVHFRKVKSPSLGQESSQSPHKVCERPVNHKWVAEATEATGVHTFAAQVVGRATGSLGEGVEPAKMINRCFWMSLFIYTSGRIMIFHWNKAIWEDFHAKLPKPEVVDHQAHKDHSLRMVLCKSTVGQIASSTSICTFSLYKSLSQTHVLRNLGEASLPFIPCTITACMLILMPLKSLDTGDGQLIEFQDPRSQQKVIHGQNDFGTKMRANIHTRNQCKT